MLPPAILIIIIITSPMGAVAKYCDIVMSMSVCVYLYVCRPMYVCLFERISPEPHSRSLPNLCGCCLRPWLCPSSSGILTIGRIAYRREGGEGSAQHGGSVIYDYLVVTETWFKVQRDDSFINIDGYTCFR